MLINPITEILQSAGISKPKNADSNSLKELLDEKSLSLTEIIEELSMLVRGSQDDSIRLRGIDKALQLHGVLKDEVSQVPQVNIIIQAPGSEGPGAAFHQSNQESQIPTIFIPRSILPVEDYQVDANR